MASRLFQCFRKELLNPLVEPKLRFSSGPSGAGGSSGSSSSKSTQQLTQNEKRILTTLKALAVFLPGVYIGHVMTDHGIFGSSEDKENGKDVKDKDKDSPDNDGKGKEKKDKT